jgi:hypothetical protein
MLTGNKTDNILVTLRQQSEGVERPLEALISATAIGTV